MSLVAAEQTFAGIAKEATVGTAVAPTNFLRVTGLTPASQPNYHPDDSMQGSMIKTYDTIPGVNATTIGVDGYCYADEINWYLAAILGDFTVTGAADPYTTAWSIKNTGQPKTYTWTDFDGAAATAFAGMMCSDLTINYSKDALAAFTSTWIGLSQASASTPTDVPGTTRALPTWGCASTINSLSTFKVIDYSVSIKRTVTADATLANSQTPGIIFAGGDLDVTGTATVAYDSSTGPTMVGYSRSGVQIPWLMDLISPSNSNRELKIQTSAATVESATIVRSLGTYTVVSVAWTANGNATDAGTSGGKSPILVTTKAGNATGTYA